MQPTRARSKSWELQGDETGKGNMFLCIGFDGKSRTRDAVIILPSGIFWNPFISLLLSRSEFINSVNPWCKPLYTIIMRV